jgi:beta-lactamase class A
MITRRQLATCVSAVLLARAVMPGGRARAADSAAGTLERRFADIEEKTGGRLGVTVLDTGSGLQTAHRGDERFPLCSTFKLLAAAAILARVDAGEENLDRPIDIRREDIVDYSPVTEPHEGGSMTLAELCAAALTLSDNTAGNLLLAALGGPQGVTAYARSLGDTATRLDRIEPHLNDVAPGDSRDTTTPSAIATDLRTLLFGDALTPKSRDQLTAWLTANKTGDTRLRAGLPAGCRVGDKTGTCNANTANDVGVVWLEGRAPVVIATYLTGATVDRNEQNAAIAAVGQAVTAAIG